MRLLETKNTTYVTTSQYHLTTVFRDNEKIKSFTREIHHDGVTYGEYVMRMSLTGSTAIKRRF